MGSTILQREVLPPRQAPNDFCAAPHCLDRQRAALARIIWSCLLLFGLANVRAHLLGTCL